ncbi:hypothetical protein OAG68_00125 [bacterium]|nr:hypothetical protein [bacterium]
MSKHHKSKRDLTQSSIKDLTGKTDQTLGVWEALRSPEPGSKVEAIVKKWHNFDLAVQRNGEWLLEGFVNTFQMLSEVGRAVDPSFPKKLPAHCFSAKHIAEFFRLPADAFSEQSLFETQNTDSLLNNMHELLLEVHHSTVLGPKQRLATLTPTQQDL